MVRGRLVDAGNRAPTAAAKSPGRIGRTTGCGAARLSSSGAGKRLAILAAKAKFHWVRMRGSSMRQKLRYVGDVLNRGWEAILEKLFVDHRPWVLRLQRIFGPLLPRSVFDNSWSRIGALQKFSSPSYPGKVVLFRAADVPVLHGDDESMGWNDIVEGGVEVVFVPGDHESMFRKPNLQFLSQRFRQALQ